jgi:hypothetical protein
MLESTWQYILAGYIAIGVATFVIVYVAHRIAKAKEHEKDIHELLAEVRKHSRGLEKSDWKLRVDDVLEDVVAPILGTLFVIVAWPLALWWKAKNERLPNVPTEEKEFAVERNHLVQRLTIEEVEAKERVTDPMGAVPNLPFGHLNTAWVQFKSGLSPQAAIWTFSAPWQSWRGQETRKGYVIVSDAGVGPFWVLDYQTDEDEPVN